MTKRHMAATEKIVQTKLRSVTRLNNSVNGNPRYRLSTDAGEFTTQTDAACGYDIDNISGAIGRGATRTVHLHLTRAGRVWAVGHPAAD